MPNRIITGPSMKFDISPELTQLVLAMAKANNETPGELLQKAIGMYDAALKAKLTGFSVGAIEKAKEGTLAQMWLL